MYHKVTVQITERLSRQRHIQNNVKHLRWSVTEKKIMPSVAEYMSDHITYLTGF